MAKKIEGDPWKDKIVPFTITGTIILTLVTAVAYSLAFAYEASYCQVFNIPKELINIDLNLLVPFWTTVVIAAISLFTFFSWIYYFVIANLNKLAKDLFFSFLLVISLRIIGETLMNIHFTWSFYGVLLILAMSSALINYYFPGLTRAPAAAGHADNSDQTVNVSELSAEEVKTRLRETLKKLRFFIVLVSAIGLIGVYNYTINSAANQALDQREFFVLTGNQQMVVLKIYGEKVICGEYNYKTRLLTGKILNFKISDSKPLEMEKKTFERLVSQTTSPFYIWKWQVTN